MSAEGLTKTFRRRDRALSPSKATAIRAVDGVDLELGRGEAFALVGESGCGKSTLARLLLRLIDPTEGRIWFDGSEITNLGRAQLRWFRRDCQMVFQDQTGSLDPRMRVRATIAEPLVIHRLASGDALHARCRELLELVGLAPSVEASFPGELSGGQRQRVAIARALATGPRVLIADEPVTALDASVRAQIVNLVGRLQRELDLTLLFIGHDLTVVEQVAERAAVMFDGRLVEVAPVDRLYRRPLHPYSAELIAAVPRFGDLSVGRRPIPPSSPGSSPGPEGAAVDRQGCVYRLRCPLAVERCRVERPKLQAVDDGGLVACHRPGELESVDSSSG